MRREEERIIVMDDYLSTITSGDVRSSLELAAVAGALFPLFFVLPSLLPSIRRHTSLISAIGVGYLFVVLILGETFTDKPGVNFWTYFRYEVLAGLVFGIGMALSTVVLWLVLCCVLGRTQMFPCYFSLLYDMEYVLFFTGVYIVLSVSTYGYEHGGEKNRKEE